MSVDTYQAWVARVRKDPLGPAGYNSLIDGYRWVEGLYGREHVLATGEHNSAEVPREVGSVYITAGPTGNYEGFRYASLASRTALGTISLKIGTYAIADQLALQATNCSETSVNVPCITQATVIDASHIEFYSKYLTSGLGVGNAWAAEDAHFVAAVHAAPAPPGVSATESGLRIKGDWFTEASTQWNAHVAADAGLRNSFLVEHSTAGVHTNREVAKTSAALTWDGAVYAATTGLSSTRNAVSSINRIGAGIVEVTWTSAWVLSAQPFVMPDYARNNGGAAGDIYIINCPRSLITATKVRFYIYKFDTTAKTWARADTNFFCAVHGG